MAQYIDKAAVVAEIIKRRAERVEQIKIGDDRTRPIDGAVSVEHTSLLSFLDTLEVKEVDLVETAIESECEDLEQAFCHYAETIDNYPSNQDEEKYMHDAFQAGSQWQKEQDQKTIELAEDHAMLAGMEKMKEEMLKDAVEGIVEISLGEKVICHKSSYGISEVSLSNWIADKYSVGDKVKLIIVKED